MLITILTVIAILLFLLFYGVSCLIRKSMREAKATVKVGAIFIKKGDDPNPFLTSYREYEIKEVKDGYVLYERVGNEKERYSSSLDNFIYLFSFKRQKDA